MSLYGIVPFAGLYFARQYFKGAQFREDVHAHGKIALITGCSSGIGKQTAKELNLRGAVVYMLCRDPDRAFMAKCDLTNFGCDPRRLIIKNVDLASFQSIRDFVIEFSSENDVVDILINNAGIMFYPHFEITEDNNELTWQTNYLGHFLLTELLRPMLEKSGNGRIVNVSSALHKRADSVDESVVNDPNKFGRHMPYCRSKLANIMHTMELSHLLRIANPLTKVTANSLHPGVCLTNLMRYNVANRFPLRQLILPLFWFFMKTDKDGAQTTLYLALSKDVQFISGAYFGECTIHKPSQKALDREACSLLYNCSVDTVGLGSASVRLNS